LLVVELFSSFAKAGVALISSVWLMVKITPAEMGVDDIQQSTLSRSMTGTHMYGIGLSMGSGIFLTISRCSSPSKNFGDAPTGDAERILLTVQAGSGRPPAPFCFFAAPKS
jgi:hypothetical protein